ncbi:MAG: hypothetical protein WD023_12300 [Ilumatobacteraceae bacterium]
MSISEVTTASAWIAGLAIIAMIAAGWRKPARATAAFTRERRSSRAPRPVPVAETHTRMHRRTPVWRKVWAILAGSTLAIVLGAVLATLISFGVAYSVYTLTQMLKS